MPIRTLDLARVQGDSDTIYEAVVVLSKRARRLNDDVKLEIQEKLQAFDVTTPEMGEEDGEINEEQYNVSLEFEKRPKPTLLAIDDLLHDRLTVRYREATPVHVYERPNTTRTQMVED